MAVLDVRPLLAAKEEPFQHIMAAVERLEKGESLVLVAPFEPRPLYAEMAARGYRYHPEKTPDGSWRVTFAPIGVPTSATAPHNPWMEQRLYQPFIRWALIVALTLGFTLGAIMLVLPVLGLSFGVSLVGVVQTHGMAQVFGWGGLFVMGFAFHVVPRFTKTTIPFPLPQRVALGLVLGGISFRFFGQVFYDYWTSTLFLGLSGILLLAAVLLFAAVVGPSLVRSHARGQTEAWIGAGIVWAIVAATLHLAIVLVMATQPSVRSAPAALDVAFTHIGLVGFLGACVFGISIHALPAFMSLQSYRNHWGRFAFVTMNAGVFLYGGSVLLGADPLWIALAWTTEFIAATAFVVSLRIFEPRPAKRPYVPGTYTRYEWYVRATFGWLLVGLGLGMVAAWDAALGTNLIPAGYALPAFHMLALGFVTMIIFGMAARMLPIFEGAELPHQRLMDFALGLLNASVVLRLAFGVLPLPGASIGLAVSGVSGLSALALFSIVAIDAMRPAAREAYQQRLSRIAQQHMGQNPRREIPLGSVPLTSGKSASKLNGPGGPAGSRQTNT